MKVRLMSVAQVWWYLPVMPAVRKPRQENFKFESSLGYNREFEASRAI
jgi:hypothetical protein